MFYGSPQFLEKSLHTDFNTLIKNVKTREDQYFTLLQYNKGLIQQFSEIDSIPFFQQELTKHRAFLEAMNITHHKIKEEEEEILQKYVCTQTGEPSILKLMGRVVARLTQMLQASLGKSKYLDEQLPRKYNEIKTKMLDLLSDKQKIDVQALFQMIISHVQIKFGNELIRLDKIIQTMVNGDFTKLNEIYVSVSPDKKIPRVSTQKKQSKKSVQKQRQRIQKIQKMKEIAKKIQQTKKKKIKTANKMIGILYTTMEVSKQPFMEDMVFTNNARDKKRQLYQQIMSRNKFNHNQILQFQSNRISFQQKINEFKIQMEQESYNIQSALDFSKQIYQDSSVKELKLIKDMKASFRKQIKSEAAQDTTKDCQSPQKQRQFRTRQKKSAFKAPSPKIFKQTYNSIQSVQEQFQTLKFDVKNDQLYTRSNRARLPQISGRSSLDHYSDKKPDKPEQKINIMKNIDIGNIILQTKQDRIKHSLQDKPIESIPVIEHTFYSRNKAISNKFSDTRINFVT